MRVKRWETQRNGLSIRSLPSIAVQREPKVTETLLPLRTPRYPTNQKPLLGAEHPEHTQLSCEFPWRRNEKRNLDQRTLTPRFPKVHRLGPRAFWGPGWLNVQEERAPRRGTQKCKPLPQVSLPCSQATRSDLLPCLPQGPLLLGKGERASSRLTFVLLCLLLQLF